MEARRPRRPGPCSSIRDFIVLASLQRVPAVFGDIRPIGLLASAPLVSSTPAQWKKLVSTDPRQERGARKALVILELVAIAAAELPGIRPAIGHSQSASRTRYLSPSCPDPYSRPRRAGLAPPNGAACASRAIRAGRQRSPAPRRGRRARSRHGEAGSACCPLTQGTARGHLRIRAPIPKHMAGTCARRRGAATEVSATPSYNGGTPSSGA